MILSNPFAAAVLRLDLVPKISTAKGEISVFRPRLVKISPIIDRMGLLGKRKGMEQISNVGVLFLQGFFREAYIVFGSYPLGPARCAVKSKWFGNIQLRKGCRWSPLPGRETAT